MGWGGLGRQSCIESGGERKITLKHVQRMDEAETDRLIIQADKQIHQILVHRDTNRTQSPLKKSDSELSGFHL